ncbi:MAG: TonB-dependent receptor [Rikenellaceae bacterium]
MRTLHKLTLITIFAATFVSLKAQEAPQIYAPRAESTHHREGMAMVRGEVTSAENREKVPFATVLIERVDEAAQSADKNRYNTTTDVNGRFRMHLPNGTYNINVSFLGYNIHEQQLNISNNEEVAPLRIALKSSSVAIESVKIVEATKSRDLQEQGYTLSSVDTQKSLLLNFDTDELLNRVSGVKIRQDGGAGSDMSYSINGLSGNSVRVYIDGVPIRNYGANFTVSSIPPAMIERIDVYKGVVPAFLSDDALGGAINVVLKSNTINMVQAAYSYGSYNTHKLDVNGQYRSKNSGFTAGGSAYYNSSDNSYEVWGDEVIYITNTSTYQNENVVARRFHDDYMSVGASANAGFSHVKWADNFKADFLFSAIDKDVQHGASMQVVYGERRTQQRSYVANLNYEKKNILPRLNVKALASYSATDRLLIDTCTYIYGWHGQIYEKDGEYLKWNKGGGEGGAASLERNYEKNFTTRLNLDYAFDKAANHTLSANVMYTNFKRDVEDPYLSALEQMLTETRYIDKITAAVSYDAKFFNERLRSSIFYKHFVQTATLNDPIVSNGQTISQEYSNSTSSGGYGAVISFAALPKILFLTLSAEKALRLPGFTELLGDVSNNIESSIDLNPEKSTNINLGTTIGPFQIKKHSSLSLNVNLFYCDVKDMIERSLVNPTDDLYGYENIGQIISKGVNLDANYALRKGRNEFELSAAGAYTDARFNLEYNEYGIAYTQYGNRLRNQPYLTANADATYRLRNIFKGNGNLLSFNYSLNYTHSFFVNWECFGGAGKDVVPTQLTHDISALYSMQNGRYAISLDVKNIFNEQVFDNYALQKPGRWVSAKFSYKFISNK